MRIGLIEVTQLSGGTFGRTDGVGPQPGDTNKDFLLFFFSLDRTQI